MVIVHHPRALQQHRPHMGIAHLAPVRAGLVAHLVVVVVLQAQPELLFHVVQLDRPVQLHLRAHCHLHRGGRRYRQKVAHAGQPLAGVVRPHDVVVYVLAHLLAGRVPVAAREDQLHRAVPVLAPLDLDRAHPGHLQGPALIVDVRPHKADSLGLLILHNPLPQALVALLIDPAEGRGRVVNGGQPFNWAVHNHNGVGPHVAVRSGVYCRDGYTHRLLTKGCGLVRGEGDAGPVIDRRRGHHKPRRDLRPLLPTQFYDGLGPHRRPPGHPPLVRVVVQQKRVAEHSEDPPDRVH